MFVKIMAYSIDSYVTSACEPLFQRPRRCVVCVDPHTDAPLNLRAESEKFLSVDSSGEAQSSAIFAVRVCNLHPSLFMPRDTPLRLCDVSLARAQSQSAFHRAIAPSRHRAIAPSRHRAIAPSRHRAIAPSRHRAIAPTRQRANAPTRQRANAPTRQRANAPTRQRANTL
jgi:hypothetical protein